MKLLFSLWVAMLLACATAWGSPITGLYEAEVAVADQSTEARSTALADALRQVAVKVTGSSGAAQSSVLNEALRSPGRYVQQYSYRTNDGAAGQPLLLRVNFDNRGVDQLLTGAGLHPWGTTRPLTIVWLVVEQGGQKLLVGAKDRGQVREMVERAAQRRVLPLRLPLLDATDQARVQPSDAWGDLHEPIRQASQRYQAQAVLVGRLAPAAPGRWQVRWTLYQGDSSRQWSQQGEKIEPLVAYGIDAATDALATSYAATAQPVTEGGAAFHWVVKDVRDLRSYRRLLDYLASLRGVGSVQPVQIADDSVRLRIIADAGEGALQQLVSLGSTLVVVPPESVSATAPIPTLLQPGERLYRLLAP